MKRIILTKIIGGLKMLSILKKLGAFVITSAIPFALKQLEKQAGKETKLGRIGTAYKESNEVYKKYKELTKDGVLDFNDVKELAPETFEGFVAIFNVVDPKYKMRAINVKLIK